MRLSTPFLIAVVLTILVNNINQAQPTGLNLIWEKQADVYRMKFTSDGEHLITVGASSNCEWFRCGNIRVWNVADSTLLRTIDGWTIGFTNDLDISSDDQKIISAHGSVYCNAFTGCVRDRAGQFEHSFAGSPVYSNIDPDGIIYSIAYSPDNNIIAAGTGYNNSGHINIYDAQYNLLRTLSGHSGNTSSLVFTPDGQYLISGGADGSIKVWDYNNGSFIHYLQHGNLLNGGSRIQLSISPDGQYFASTGDGYNLNIKIWRTSDWSVIHTFEVGDPYGSNGYTEFTPNGIYLGVRVSYISNQDHIRFYKVETGELVREYIDTTSTASNQNGIRALTFSPTANHNFAYSIGSANYGRLKLVSTDLNLVENQVVPVELSSFNAIVNDNDVTLNWVTSSELNNSGFWIERLQTYEITILENWEKVGFVRGEGTTTNQKEYSFIDKDLSGGKYFYRLKQVDHNGSYEYSDVIKVDVRTLNEYALEQNYPNPFNPVTTIEYVLKANSNAKLTLLNAIGEEVAVLVNDEQDKGFHKVDFNASALANGVYFYRLQAGNYVQTRKMILLK